MTPETYQWLSENRGISEKTAKENKIGLWVKNSQKRFSIPVQNNQGHVANIRLWLPPVGIYADPKKRKEAGKIISWPDHVKGRGQVRPFPLDQLKASSLVLCEGEMDALSLISHDIPAITATGGAGTWKDGWSLLFKGKTVTIAYDNDEAGDKGAKKIAESLVKAGAKVKILIWPKDRAKGYDISDEILKSIDSLKRLLVDTTNYQPSNDWPIPIPFDDYSNLPQFPIEMLPGIGQGMVEAAAECYQVAAGLPATVYLGVLVKMS